jgi:uncharacterized damage-inducible protein DinB
VLVRAFTSLQENVPFMDSRYPIGKFQQPLEATPELRKQAIEIIAETPGRLRAAVAGLSPTQLDTPYRDGGWSLRQVVHHVADSHMNAYIRHRLALTEDQPAIKPYEEGLWAKLPDAISGPVEMSLALLDAMHDRWVRLWRSQSADQFGRVLIHPDHGPRTIDWVLFLYAWHGRHHTAHITELRKSRSW